MRDLDRRRDAVLNLFASGNKKARGEGGGPGRQLPYERTGMLVVLLA